MNTWYGWLKEAPKPELEKDPWDIKERSIQKCLLQVLKDALLIFLSNSFLIDP